MNIALNALSARAGAGIIIPSQVQKISLYYSDIKRPMDYYLKMLKKNGVRVGRLIGNKWVKKVDFEN